MRVMATNGFTAPKHAFEPEHSSLTVTRQRLPQAVHEAVFARILELAATKGLLRGRRARWPRRRWKRTR